MAKKPAPIANAASTDDDDIGTAFVSPPIRIVSAVEGFWRGGIRHTRAGTDHEEGALTEEQLKLIADEPMLTVMRLPRSIAPIASTEPPSEPGTQSE